MSTTEESQRYWTVLTEVGEAEYTQAQLEDRKVPYTYLVLGDGGGLPVEPSRTQTALVNEVHRAHITAAYTKPNNPNWLYLEAVVPASVGGFWVREIGAQTSTGKLIAVGNYPASYKPTLEDNGLARDLKITLVVETTGSAAPTLVIDPSLIFATLASIAVAIDEHKADQHAHPNASTQKNGFTRLATLEETRNIEAPRNDIAVTPAGLAAVVSELVDAMPDDSMPAHLQASDPHSQYFNAQRLSKWMTDRDKATRPVRFFHANF